MRLSVLIYADDLESSELFNKENKTIDYRIIMDSLIPKDLPDDNWVTVRKVAQRLTDSTDGTGITEIEFIKKGRTYLECIYKYKAATRSEYIRKIWGPRDGDFRIYVQNPIEAIHAGKDTFILHFECRKKEFIDYFYEIPKDFSYYFDGSSINYFVGLLTDHQTRRLLKTDSPDPNFDLIKYSFEGLKIVDIKKMLLSFDNASNIMKLFACRDSNRIEWDMDQLQV